MVTENAQCWGADHFSDRCRLRPRLTRQAIADLAALATHVPPERRGGEPCGGPGAQSPRVESLWLPISRQIDFRGIEGNREEFVFQMREKLVSHSRETRVL